MSTTDLELAAADMVARLDDRSIADLADEAQSDFVRGAATAEKIARDRRVRTRRSAA